MFTVILLVALIGIAALAPRFGTDSRNLGNGSTDSTHSLPDRGDYWTSSYPR